MNTQKLESGKSVTSQLKSQGFKPKTLLINLKENTQPVTAQEIINDGKYYYAVQYYDASGCRGYVIKFYPQDKIIINQKIRRRIDDYYKTNQNKKETNDI